MVTYHIKNIVSELRNYPNLDYNQRHVFWRRLQALLFLALLPLFLCLGILSRALKKLMRSSSIGSGL